MSLNRLGAAQVEALQQLIQAIGRALLQLAPAGLAQPVGQAPVAIGVRLPFDPLRQGDRPVLADALENLLKAKPGAGGHGPSAAVMALIASPDRRTVARATRSRPLSGVRDHLAGKIPNNFMALSAPAAPGVVPTLRGGATAP